MTIRTNNVSGYTSEALVSIRFQGTLRPTLSTTLLQFETSGYCGKLLYLNKSFDYWSLLSDTSWENFELAFSRSLVGTYPRTRKFWLSRSGRGGQSKTTYLAWDCQNLSKIVKTSRVENTNHKLFCWWEMFDHLGCSFFSSTLFHRWILHKILKHIENCF